MKSQSKSKTIRLLAIAALAIAAFIVPAGNADAQPFTVTKEADSNDGTCNADCSLREAIAATNATTSNDVITVPAGHYVLSLGELHVNKGTGSLAVNGADARTTTVDGNHNSRVFEADGPDVSFSQMTITNGDQIDQGGGIFNDDVLTLTNVAVIGNRTIGDATFGGQGGGIFNNNVLTINQSLVAGNHADAPTATNSGGQGGGIFNNDTGTYTNVTVTGNDVSAGTTPSADGQGGGIFNNDTGTYTNVTVTNNQTESGGQAGGMFLNDTTHFHNTIVAGNLVGATSSNCLINSTGLTSDHSLEGGTDCPFTDPSDKHSADPLLGALANNGGPTDTQALGAGSPALGGGANCPATDQRGVARPANGCDIGAFQVGSGASGADLGLTMSANPVTIVQGGVTKVTAILHNGGPDPATGAGLNLTLPSGATLTSDAVLHAASPCAVTGCSAGTIASGGSATLDLPVRIAKTGTFTLAGDASSAASDPAAGNNHAAVNVKVTKLSAAQVLGLPSAKRCASRRKFKIHIRRPNGIVIAKATVSVNGKRVKSLKGKRVTSVVNLKGLPKGTVNVKIAVVTDAGVKLTGSRKYHTCHTRLKGGKHRL